MAFRPNVSATIRRYQGTNLFGEPSWGDVENVRIGVVHLAAQAAKTSVRTDSSASRGNAEERVVVAKILFPVLAQPRVMDLVEFAGQTMMVKSVEPRIAVTGRLDHLECEMELYVDV